MSDIEYELLGISEIQEVSGLARATLDTYRWRGSLPEPDYVISTHPIWKRATVEAWLDKRKK